VGIGSQYWLKALSGGPAHWLAARATTMLGPKASVNATRVTTPKRETIDSVKPPRC
jgi:hypothetical protein